MDLGENEKLKLSDTQRKLEVQRVVIYMMDVTCKPQKLDTSVLDPVHVSWQTHFVYFFPTMDSLKNDIPPHDT